MVNGHTTTTDLLWSGVPQITFPYSENMPSRVAASIVLALECPEMIAYSY
jgi:predicted O-linked N-acetylglucosamine transferase (SPINDLY family)